MTEKPFENVAESKEAGYADDLRDFRWNRYGIEEWAGLVLLCVTAILVFMQFFSRYALNDSVAWTEEVARYLLMVLTFVGAAVAVKRGAHIRVEALESALPPRARRVLYAVQDVIRLGFWVFGAWIAVDLADRMGVMPMDSLPHSLASVYCPVACAFVLMAQREAQWIWRRWRHQAAPVQDIIA